MPVALESKPQYLRKDRGIVGSKAFNLEYDAPPTRGELKRDVVSYLGEYRLQVQKYDYELVYGRERSGRGPITLRDGERGEPLSHMAKRVIEERTRRGDPVHRERAEELGIDALNEALRTSKTGDTIVWASPPGPKEQGYGDYGFVYAGRVRKLPNGEAHLAMSAIRIEKPTIEGYNKVLSSLSGEKLTHTKAEQFLAKPLVIHEEISQKAIEQDLKTHLPFTPDEKEKAKFDAIMKQMDPLIDEFLDVMDRGSKAEKVKSFYTLENYALQLKKDFEKAQSGSVVYVRQLRLDDLADKFSHKPPVARGSCGATGSSVSSNGLLSAGSAGEVAGSIFGSDKYGSREFNCPSCGSRNVRDINELLKNCQSCGSAEVGC